jgi:hypothetical protein
MAANPKPPWPQATDIELVGAPVVTKGAIRRVHLDRGKVNDELIERFEAPYRLHYRIENGWGFPIDAIVSCTHGEHELEALAGGRTRVTWRGFVTPRAWYTRPIARVLTPYLLGGMQRRFLASLARSFTPPAS